MKRIAVTGARGFVGRALLTRLRQKGIESVAISRGEPAMHLDGGALHARGERDVAVGLVIAYGPPVWLVFHYKAGDRTGPDRRARAEMLTMQFESRVTATRAAMRMGTLVLAALLTSCGGGDAPTPPLAEASDVTVGGDQAGATPFIRFVELRGSTLAKVSAIAYTIAPKAGAASRPVAVSYTLDALRRRGYASADGGVVALPVFGLYAGRANSVSVTLTFQDGSTHVLPTSVTALPYVDPNALYDRPTVRVARAPGSVLGFDYFYIKSGLATPIVVDTDGEPRWVGVGATNSFSSAFVDNAFLVGSQTSSQFAMIELDGSTTQRAVLSPSYASFHHNIDPGKNGWLAAMNGVGTGPNAIESILAEISPSGAVLREWDFAAILGDYMRSQGDDPSAFIRAGADWFHMNATTYDPRDDTVIVSSRESFLVKVGYTSGQIVWIFGDPTKYWYSFPSLRAKALTLQPGGFYPIGQHATSITSDGLLMLFNDGLPSTQQPAGVPVGEARAFSIVSAYAIDATARTATETWRYDHDPSILSDVCSSAYEASGRSLLISYAVANGRTKARLIGLDSSRQVVFDFEYPTSGCSTSWNAVPIAFDNLKFR